MGADPLKPECSLQMQLLSKMTMFLCPGIPPQLTDWLMWSFEAEALSEEEIMLHVTPGYTHACLIEKLKSISLITLP